MLPKKLAAAREEHAQLFGLLRRRRAAGRRQSAARDEVCCQGITRTIVRLIKTQPGSRQGRNFFPLGCCVPLGVNTNNCSACVPGSQAQPESDPGAAGCSQRLYVYIGYAARYPEQSRTIVRLNPESRIPIPMTTRTIHRVIFSAARCAPNLPQQRPDNPNNLSGYARGLRFSQRESPR